MSGRCLIIGNSQCAAMRSALAQGRTARPQGWRGLSISFAAAHALYSGSLALRDGLIAPQDDAAARNLRQLNGRGTFPVADLDAVAFCGGMLTSFALVRLHGAARWHPLPSMQGQGAPPDDRQLISEDAALAAATGAARGALLFPLLRQLRAETGLRLFVIQEPRLSLDAVGTGRKVLGFTRIAEGPDGAALSALYDRALGAACDGLAEPILQPVETRAQEFFTDPAFRRGATRLTHLPDVPQPPDDYLHCNAAYGEMQLDALVARLGVAA
jgi:hypothetical protein